MAIKYATQSTASTNSVNPKEANSFKSLFEAHFETPLVLIDKSRASTFIPASFRVPTRNDESIQSSSLVIFDVDQKLGQGYDDDMIALEEAEDALLDLGLEHFIYTSHSHTIEAPRFRIVIAASRSFHPAEHNTICAAILEHLDEFLGGRLLKVIDPCWKTLSQCYYVYTAHPDRRQFAISFYNPGAPADIDEYKLHQSTYGIETEYRPGAPRQATGQTGARGRSYELNRILGGMITSSTEEEIAKRLFEVDNTLHAGNGYFRDPQYPRNRPRAGESNEAAAWRSCQLFTKSHINSLKRKTRKPVDTTIVNKKADSREPMPTHDAMIKIRSAKVGKTKAGAETVLMELQVMSGEHAGRHLWHRLYGTGSNATAIKISDSIKTKIAKATKLEIPTISDITNASDIPMLARIKYKPGTNGYPAQNELGDVHLN
ncbi:DUF669 domain-containing protein [Pseudomonas sp. BP01]|uniref:DUF669 domain-containing protein n=1 Tax=Pseudomonas sp. BP01 TaxID=2976152 RepID=UPI001FA99740|nr:DUF669 domain-containing protein [Pseudomonas sp. BP01]